MKDREKFIKNWEKQRNKGELKYVLINAGLISIFPLVGTIIGSLFIYNPSSPYCFSYYLPTYYYVWVGSFIIGTLKSKYEWGKKEESYNKLFDKA